MATPADLLSQAATAIGTLIAGVARLSSDYRDDLDSLAAGSTAYQLRGGPAGKSFESNSSPLLEAVEVLLHHRLADPTDERTYTEGNLQTYLASLIDPAWWRALAACLEVIDAPQYGVEREVNVITATVRATVSIVP